MGLVDTYGCNLLGARSIVVGLLVCVLVCLYLRLVRSRHRNLPPGPWGWPVVGSLPQMVLSGELPQLFLSKLATRFGDVFSLNILGQLVVVINKYPVVKKAFAQAQLCDRPVFHIFNKLAPGFGLVSSSGEEWAVLRKFHSTVFRGFGMGRSTFEENISKESGFLVAEFKKQDGGVFDPRHFMNNTLSNIFCGVVFGKRFEYTDPMFKNLLCAASSLTDESGAGLAFEVMPKLTKTIGLLLARRYIQAVTGLYSNIYRLVKEYEQNEVHDLENPRNFMDHYLAKCAESERQDTPEAKAMKPEYMTRAIGEIFVAGTETTSTTLRWGLLYMMVHPQVQKRVQEELDGVTGRDRCPGLADRSSLPYTEAVMCEIQRMCTLAPLSLPHYCSKDTQINGYTISKGAIVLSNLWHIHNDPLIWSEPKEFRPERFLDDEGRFRPREELLSFGLGRRVCIGENLARMENFIIFTQLLHRFTFEKPDSSRAVSLDGNLGITWSPSDCRVRAITRDANTYS